MSTPKPRNYKKRGMVVVAISAAWLVCSIAIVRSALLHPPEYHQWWKSGDPEPLPQEFRFVLFPPADGLPILETPDGAQVGTLRRAVLSDPGENEMQYVPVSDASVKGVIQRSALRWTAPKAEADRLVAALVAERRGRGPDYARYNCTLQLPESSTGTAQVEIRMGEGSIRSQYLLSANGAVPTEVAAWSAPGAGIEGAARFLVSLVGVIVLGIVAVGVSIWVLVCR
jgi:hypothetical protein